MYTCGCNSDRLARHNAARTAKGLPEQQPKQIVAEYTQLLNQYNSVKDAAQLIFDKVGTLDSSYSFQQCDDQLTFATSHILRCHTDRRDRTTPSASHLRQVRRRRRRNLMLPVPKSVAPYQASTFTFLQVFTLFTRFSSSSAFQRTAFVSSRNTIVPSSASASQFSSILVMHQLC